MGKKYFEKEKNFISIVIYMSNAQNSIANFLKEVDNILFENFQAYEFVLVDDYSQDDSIKVATDVAGQLRGSSSIIKLAWKHGLEKAMIAGTDLAIGDFVYEFDSTVINYDVELIMELYKKAMMGFDVVAASPSTNKKTSSSVFYKILKKISYRNMELETESFRIISRRAINRISTFKTKLKYRKASNHYAGFNTENIYYKPVNNNVIENDMSFAEKNDLAWNVFIGYSNIGSKISGFISFAFFILAVVTIIYTALSYIMVDNIEPGWTAIMLFLSLSFSGLFIILNIILRYLTYILIEVQEQPQYVYKVVDKIRGKH